MTTPAPAPDEAHKGFTNRDCRYFPCHRGVEREFNCLFCYCPLNALECPGPYTVITSANGVVRKNCSACTLPHDGHRQSWGFIRKWLERPLPWRGLPQTRRRPADPEAAAAAAEAPDAGTTGAAGGATAQAAAAPARTGGVERRDEE